MNTGMASAMTQATTHSTSVMPTQDPMDRKLLFCIRSVPLNRRTYMYFAATWPLITPAITIYRSISVTQKNESAE